jgi:hypothetical protein
MLWRFRAAPLERRIMVYGSLCSTWPVHSGILVEGGTLFAASGVIDYDGTYVYALDAVTGALKWENGTTGHLREDIRKGVSAQGILTVHGGRLWMAGGNVVSPVSFDIETGEYLGKGPHDGSPRANRGEEIGVLNDRFLVFGGRLRYSAMENVVNPGGFEIAEIGPDKGLEGPMHLFRGRVPGAWNGSRVICVDGRFSAPACYSLTDVCEYATARSRDRIPQPLWRMELPDDSDVVSMALAGNAVAFVYRTKIFRRIQPRWTFCTLNPMDGSLISQARLQTPALPGGLLVDGDGRVVIAGTGGEVTCYADAAELLTQMEPLIKMAAEDPASKEEAIRRLTRLLSDILDQENRRRLLATLAELGVDVGRDSRRQGFITHWHLWGPVPFSTNDPIDKEFLGEPNVNVETPHSLGPKEIPWREFVTELGSGEMELTRIYGECAGHAIYAYAEVNLAEARNLLLKVGSDDGIRVWFNGEHLGTIDAYRSYAPDQNEFPVQGRQGKNTILVKVTQGGGGWAFGARLTDRQGGPIDLN